MGQSAEQTINQHASQSRESSVSRIPGTRLAIALGNSLLMNIGKMDGIKSQLVGAAPYDYLIVKMPLIPGMRQKLIEGLNIVVRYFSDGTVYGFKTELINHVFKPAPLIFITYPDFIEKYDLRQSRRVECLIPGKVHAKGGVFNALITDLSTGGTKIIVESEKHSNLTAFQPDDMVVLDFTLFSSSPIMMSSVVRNVNLQINKATLGLQFDGTPEESKQIDDYIGQILMTQ